jgi:hypothetical protein
MVIIGSAAAKKHFPNFRDAKDLDVLERPEKQLALKEAYKGERRLECYYYGPSTDYLLDRYEEGSHLFPCALYTLKAAHFKFDVHWEKTASDIIFFQREGVKLDEALYKLAFADFKALYGKRWASLKGKDSKTFFEDAVKRKYVHDSLHETVKYYERPLYESILTGEGVQCSKEKFEALSHEDQLKLAKEEIFVTGLERNLIPTDFKFSANRAYWLSLKKFIISMSSSWMSKFLIDNFSKLAKNNDDYVTKFKQNKHKLILC